MTTILKTLFCVVPCALALVLGACGSTHRAANPAPGYSAVSAARSATSVPLNGSPDPGQGCHEIFAHLVWHQGTLKSPDRVFYWTKTAGKNPGGLNQPILMIAGGIGTPGTGGNCVKPPLRAFEEYFPGLDIESCPGKDPGTAETVTLYGGFLCVQVGPGTKSTGHGNLGPWRLIIKTHAIPAGAYSTDYVLLGIPMNNDTSREYIFRPNQNEFNTSGGSCSKVADKDGETSVEVHARMPSGSILHMKDTSYVMFDRDGTNSSKPSNVGSPEDGFLTDVCAFLKEANAYINGQPNLDPYTMDCNALLKKHRQAK